MSNNIPEEVENIDAINNAENNNGEMDVENVNSSEGAMMRELLKFVIVRLGCKYFEEEEEEDTCVKKEKNAITRKPTCFASAMTNRLTVEEAISSLLLM